MSKSNQITFKTRWISAVLSAPIWNYGKSLLAWPLPMSLDKTLGIVQEERGLC